MILIKVGGGTALNTTGIVQDIKHLNDRVVFVHGASVQRDQLASRLGHPTRTITSPSGQVSVLTDRPALDILVMAYAGLANKTWVAAFQSQGVNAVGLSGADGRLLQGSRKTHLIAFQKGKQKLISGTFTGKVTTVNAGLIKLLLNHGYTPVITQPALSESGELINTDNDRNLAVIAQALGIKKMVILFEAPGLLKDVTDPSSLVSHINADSISDFQQYAQGTMKKKLLGAREAFQAGVTKIYWGDSRTLHPVKQVLAGKGTIIS